MQALLIVLLLAAASGAAHAAEAMDARAIWLPTGEVAQSLPGACAADQPDCLPDLMRKAGASPAAVAFARSLNGEGYAESFVDHGRVDLVTAFFPFYANSNWRQFLVNGDPAVVDLNDWDRLEALDVDGDAAYRKLAAAYPEAILWPAAEFMGVQEAADQGQRFLVYYPILNGCHACDVLGWANVAYDFDADGKLRDLALISVEAP
jgi:hypothetical protein